MHIQIVIDDELYQQAVSVTGLADTQALLETALRSLVAGNTAGATQNSLAAFLQQSPLSEVDLVLSRDPDTGRAVEL